MSGIEALDILAEKFARLPGIGRKSAERLAFAVLEYSHEDVEGFARAMTEAKPLTKAVFPTPRSP